ncbi:helix-turn-helix domain-containing protein [Usitatibacter rugosus]|jgi:hypothetical protein|uniref:helix-turn-helix domain-containing protein n=1 Tax=Usitatibacter rugosus TaxID=2732067 RepID=UPI001487E618|nr:LysR family transcriptional regulator [Usitatibacter rugosus]
MAFEACVRHGSVTRAAEELSLAQPTISGHLRKLTDTLGEPLLQHRCGRMEPTDTGRRLALLCEDIYAAFDRFESQRDLAPQMMPATARVAMTGAGLRLTLDVEGMPGAVSSALPPPEEANDGTAPEEDPLPGGGTRGDGGLRGDGGEERLEGRDRDRR